MITQVRIAPVEQWCRPAQREAKHEIAGRMIEIDTNSMQTEGAPCGGRYWDATFASEKQILETIGDLDERWSQPNVCEHMLEMD